MESMLIDLPRKIKRIREEKEITQKELAKMSGVSYSTLTKLETGVIKNPSFEVVLRIIKALEIDLSDLMWNENIQQ